MVSTLPMVVLLVPMVILLVRFPRGLVRVPLLVLLLLRLLLLGVVLSLLRLEFPLMSLVELFLLALVGGLLGNPLALRLLLLLEFLPILILLGVLLLEFLLMLHVHRRRVALAIRRISPARPGRWWTVVEAAISATRRRTTGLAAVPLGIPLPLTLAANVGA